MACSLSNKYTTKFRKQAVLVELIAAEDVVTCYVEHGVDQQRALERSHTPRPSNGWRFCLVVTRWPRSTNVGQTQGPIHERS